MVLICYISYLGAHLHAPSNDIRTVFATARRQNHIYTIPDMIKPPFDNLYSQLQHCRDALARTQERLQEVDIKRATAEAELFKQRQELEARIVTLTIQLERKDIALKEVFSQLDIEKQNLSETIDRNVENVLMPIIDKLIEKSSSIDSRYLMMLKQNLQNLTSSTGSKLSSLEYNLTAREIELCALIKGGFSIKEIATMHNLSPRTVETHRLNIRKKLGINSAGINLAAYLSQL